MEHIKIVRMHIGFIQQVEVLFEEILKTLHKHNDADISSHVRAAFKKSPFKHIVSASKTG